MNQSRHVRSTKLPIVIVSLCLLSIAFFYGNCSPEHKGTVTTASVGYKSGTCSVLDEEHLFALTYHPMLQRECSTCHIPGGRKEDMPFASPGLNLAYSSFRLIGYKQMSTMAVRLHGSGGGGKANPTEVQEITKLWQIGVQELKTCKNVVIEEFVDDPWNSVRVHSKNKAINPNLNGVATVTWNLLTDDVTGADQTKDIKAPPEGVVWPAAPGAVFKLDFLVDVRDGSRSYIITRPRIEYPTPNAAATDLKITSLRIRLNGQDVINETTFHYLEANARKNTNTFLSAGGMVALGDLKTTDVVSVSFGKIEAIELPPPPPAPSVEFLTATSVIGETGKLRIPVRLSSAVDTFVTVNYTVGPALSNKASAEPRCYDTNCPLIRNNANQEVRIKNFSRDFTFLGISDQEILVDPNQATLVFDPNQTEQFIDIQIIDDQRDEPDEYSTITLTNGSSDITPINVGTIKTHEFKITDDDAAPASTAITYTLLMSPGGPFHKYCLKCHHASNTNVLEREYDMTTYSDLLVRNRIVPGNVSASLVWRRINGRDENNQPVEPMPQGGILDNDAGLIALDMIEKWIQQGAKNN